MKANDFAVQLASLKRDFIASLPERLTIVVAAWHELDNNLQRDEQQLRIQQLHRTVHGITGAAGSFGLMELSSSCRQFESFLKAIITDNGALSDAQRQQGNALLSNIHAQRPTDTTGKNDLH